MLETLLDEQLITCPVHPGNVSQSSFSINSESVIFEMFQKMLSEREETSALTQLLW